MAKSLDVSRTPVREGLAALAREGLLVRSGRSFTLPSMELEDINEIYEMRCLVEPQAIGRAAETARPSDVAELSDALLAQRTAHAAEDVGAFIAGNERFRNALLALVPNRRLRQSMALYSDHMNFLRVRLDRAHWREVVIENLQALVQAFRNGDKATAASIWQRHIGDADAAAREWLREVHARTLSDDPFAGREIKKLG